MTKKPFEPPKLPPSNINYISLIELMGKANKALGVLNGMLENVPNYHLLTTPLMTKEAVLSSSIEGTHATLEDVFKYEAENKKTQKNEKEKDVKEIINYRKAVAASVSELKKRPIGENLIKKAHYVLLDSVRGAHKDRGNIRKKQVYVGLRGLSIEEAVYIPPPPAELPNLISNWEKYINSDKEKDPLIQIGVAHYQFEAIHPFMDGNGRIGRLLIPLFLYSRNFCPYPLLYISEFFEKYKKEYIHFLHMVDEKGDWTSWLKFFLKALETQALKTQTTVTKMIKLYNDLKSKVIATNSVYAIELLDILFVTPIITFSTIKKRIRTNSYQTIYNLLRKFTKIGIIEEISGKKRNKMFALEVLLDIL